MKKTVLFSVIFFVILFFAMKCDSSSFSSKEIKWKSNGTELSGTLLLSDNPAKSLIILIHGSGNIDRTSSLYSAHAKKLAKMGAAVFYYDKRGVGESKGDWKNATFNDLALDAIKAIPKLLEYPEVANAKVGFMGFSQGGWINLLAHQQYTKTSFLISISGSVNTPEDQGRYINKKTLEGLGYGQAIHQIVDSIEMINSKVYRTNSGWKEAENFIKPYKSEPWFKDLGLGLQSKDSWNWKWYGNLPSDFNPKTYLEKLDIPLFAAHGGKDLLVDGNNSYQYLENLKDHGKNITNYYDVNGRHGLRDKKAHLIFWKKSYWSDEYWNAIQSWLSEEDLI